MNIARQWVQCLSGLALLITAFCGVSHGQQRFPEVFHGVWIVGVAEDNSCKASDWDKHENDGLLRVDTKEARWWESLCNVRRLRPSPWDGGTSADLTLSCGGEGEISTSREISSVVNVGARKALMMTQIEASDSVPEGSKKTPLMRRVLSGRLYLACE